MTKQALSHHSLSGLAYVVKRHQRGSSNKVVISLLILSVLILYLAFSLVSAIRKKFGFRSQTLKSIMPSEKKK